MNKWIKDRVSEPSTWAALGVCAVALGLLFNSFSLPLIAIAVGVAAVILKEKGLI
tara:strand:+ start:1407 stop:1571 length:165 start_codon:yes stop_codon:yes gene_type:complete